MGSITHNNSYEPLSNSFSPLKRWFDEYLSWDPDVFWVLEHTLSQVMDSGFGLLEHVTTYLKGSVPKNKKMN